MQLVHTQTSNVQESIRNGQQWLSTLLSNERDINEEQKEEAIIN